MLITLLLACGSGEDTRSKYGLPEGDATAGAEIYAANCESCHGEDGAQGTQVGGVPATDLGSIVPDVDDDRLYEIITEGYGEMPPVSLDEQQAADCIAYLRQQFAGG